MGLGWRVWRVGPQQLLHCSKAACAHPLTLAHTLLSCMGRYLNILADVLSAVAGTIIPPGAEPGRAAYLIGGGQGGCTDSSKMQRGGEQPLLA